MEQQIFNYRQQARFIIEAVTPLALSNGQKDVMTDAKVATDVNGLPYLPGTTIAGIFRSMLAATEQKADKGETTTDKLFGWQEEFKNEGEGSRIAFSEGKILNSKGEVVDEIFNDASSDPLLKEYLSLPIRQHAKIGPAGTTVDTGKFDEQVVFAGTRFCFQIELLSETEDPSQLKELVGLTSNISFRIGGGSRKGFGEVKVIKAGIRTFNLTDVEGQLKKYLDSSSKLENNWDGWDIQEKTSSNDTAQWVTYTLHLHSDSFLLFGSGMGDVEGTADMTAVSERMVEGPDNNRKLSDPYVLIPASSIKGALAHRVAYHYNRLKKYYVGNPEAKTGDENEAVRSLFGSNTGEITRGNVLMADILVKPVREEKLINHVAIDQLTGGAMTGALFTEKTSFQCQPFDFTFHVSTDAFKQPKVEEALEAAIEDICTGRLPLGGGVNRGQGVFAGTYESNLN